MNTKTKKMFALAILAAGIMVLTGVCVTQGQNPDEKSEDSVVTAVAYTSEDLRDPFEGYVIEEVIPVDNTLQVEENVILPALAVSGITWGSSFAQAIINDKVVKAGDMIGDVKVLAIAKEGLVFLYRNRQFSLPAPGASGVPKSGQNTNKYER